MTDSGLAVGLMSGTSADGIDAVVVRFTELSEPGQPWEGAADGPRVLPVRPGFPGMELVAARFFPFTPEQRAQVFSLFDPLVPMRTVAEWDVQLGHWFGEAAAALMASANVAPREVAVIGSHGQTVYHAPERGTSLQVGDPAVIARVTECPVVADFRRADIAAGGQGAPLVPYFDFGYLASPSHTRVVLNIGGISNITVLPPATDKAQVTAFDTGPGNMLVDALVQELTDGASAFDEEGRWAASGKPDTERVEAWIRADAYLHRPPPKSTGRERYGVPFLPAYREAMRGLSAADQVATLTQFVARTVAMGIRSVVNGPFELIVSGGGRHNRTLVDWIEAFAEPSRVLAPETFGIPTDMKEAMAFALLAWQFVHGRPTNLPSATGARAPVVLGRWTPRPCEDRSRS
ncbi:MAG: anhydro-N-acetylmuramic acid kinase [Alicyclobacillus sp.]|nr:anhydro-N-acetylmuramic acid kinase [Alicyclobacillus sp.]